MGKGRVGGDDPALGVDQHHGLMAIAEDRGGQLQLALLLCAPADVLHAGYVELRLALGIAVQGTSSRPQSRLPSRADSACPGCGGDLAIAQASGLLQIVVEILVGWVTSWKVICSSSASW